jgi:hypothetical protein
MRFAMMLCAAAFLFTGCSSFNRDYESAVAAGWPADSIEGPWHGRWQSHAGHGGDRLRAVVTRSPSSPDTYHARFRAKFWLIFHSNQDVDLKVTSTNPTQASGEKDLGWLYGGVYQYDAALTPTQFDATYRSKHDHGVFSLTRPPP